MDTLKYQPNNIEEEEKTSVQWYRLGVTKDKIKDTPKLFYNKFAFKADLNIPGARLIQNISRHNTFNDFCVYINTLIERKNKSGNTGWNNTQYKGIDAKPLYSFYKSIVEFKSKIRIRGEGIHLSICAESEEILYEVIRRAKAKKYITSICLPASKTAIEKLKDNTMFVSNPKFKFRAMIRSGNYDNDTKRQISNYFKNYKDLIFVSKNILKTLNNDLGGSYLQGYFHVNNTDILLFLKMIHPRFVGRIFSIEKHEDK